MKKKFRTTSPSARIRRAERALRDSESRYRLLFELNPCPMFIFDENTLDFLDVNEAALRLYGYSRAAFLAMTARDIRPAEDAPKVVGAIRAQGRLLQSGTAKGRRPHGRKSIQDVPLSVGEWRHERRDGTVFDAAITVSAIQFSGRLARLVMVNDITARKEAEDALRNMTVELERRVVEQTAAWRETAERLQMTMAAAKAVAWELDLASGMLLENGPVDELRVTPEGVRFGTDKAFFDRVHPDDRDYVRAQVKRAIESESGEHSAEFRLVLPDGRFLWLGSSGSIDRNSAGLPVRLRGISLDITARKQSEAALARTNRALRVLTESNRMLLRVTGEQELLDAACRIVVEVGGYRMAWVGYAEHDARKSIRPVAAAGFVKEHLLREPLTWADTKLGRSPAAVAIRTGLPCVCLNLSKDPLFAPRRNESKGKGVASLLALPLLTEYGCLGVVTIYSAQTDAFDDSESQLLQQLAYDLSLGIMTLRGRLERKELARQVLDIGEKVQRRIGQDLHDGVGQSIIGIGYLISAVQQTLASKSAPEAVELKRVTRLVGDAVQEMRDMARGLFPGELMNGRLTDALQELARHTQDVFGMACHFTGSASIRLADANLASQVYRIAQEAVNNAAKHSKANEIRIGLSQKRGSIVLTIRDTGVGFPKTAGKDAGMGQRILKYRADLIGATLKIESVRGQGTTVTCTLPPLSLNKTTQKEMAQ